jgi:3-oxoacyl-[acyl-carrier protein] reductase
MSGERVVLVTGASRGIGAHLVAHFAARGDRVVWCSRSVADVAPGGRVVPVQADVSDEAAVRDLMRLIRRTFGRLDVVVNNAGIALMNPAALMPTQAIDRIMDVNFKGTVLVSRESVKLMQRSRFGRIINMSSVAVPMRIEGESIYAASKSAVETFTRIFAKEVYPLGITCNAVGPAPVNTDLIRGVPKEKINALVARLATRELASVEDVAHVVSFLAAPASGYLTGQVIYLGGVS